MKVLRLSVLPLRTVLVALTLSALAFTPFAEAADFALNPARDFGAIRRIDPRDYSGLAVVREDGSGLSSSTAAAFRAALEVFSKAEVNASDALNVRLDGSRNSTGFQRWNGNYGVAQSTNDGADTGSILGSGGGYTSGNLYDRGAAWILYGNEYTTIGGQARYYAGNVSTGDHVFYTGDGTERLRIGYGGTSTFGGNVAIGSNYLKAKTYGYFGVPPAAIGAVYSTYGPALWYNAMYDSVDGRWESQSSGNQSAVTLSEGRFYFNQSTTPATGPGLAVTWNTPFMIEHNGNVLIGTTTDDGSNKLQVNGSAYARRFVVPNDYGYRCLNSSGGLVDMMFLNSSNVSMFGSAAYATRINSNGTLTHNGSTIWTAANDGSGSGLDADTLDTKHASDFVATSTYTASDVLTKIKTVDGSGSGLDADTVPNATPASATAAGTAGMIRYDANYIYICTATNTWKRVAISTW